MYININKLDQIGDTIIEVLIALLIIGTVLGGAFEISALSLRTQLASSHRSQALQIAQTQLEALKSQVATNSNYIVGTSSITGASSVCMANNATTLVISGTTANNCVFDATGAANTSATPPAFTVDIKNRATGAVAPNPWSQVEVNVTWPADNLANSATDSLSLYYDFSNGQ
jgi:Tfp pilus assembly protein PilV